MSKTLEPIERFEHRIDCKFLGYSGICYKRSGSCQFGGALCHLSIGCDGGCRRMKMWDSKHGYKGIEFKLRDIL